MKLRTDAFEALAVLVRPVGFDTETVGDLPADSRNRHEHYGHGPLRE